MNKFTAVVRSGDAIMTNYDVAFISFVTAYTDGEQEWATATPAASIAMNVNHAFAETFRSGKYRITFERVDE